MIGNVLVAVVAIIHVYIAIVEMVYWDKPLGQKMFGIAPDFSRQTKVLAANQGLYNGFLAAGLIYGLIQGSDGFAFKVFFLLCVAIAGLYGAVTASRKIIVVQTLPAVLALVAVWAAA
jgi:putative membrane protein